MKLYVEITLTKTEGPVCDEATVLEAIASDGLDGVTFYPQESDHDDESAYEVEQVELLSQVLTVAQIKDGTGWTKGAKFVQVAR